MTKQPKWRDGNKPFPDNFSMLPIEIIDLLEPLFEKLSFYSGSISEFELRLLPDTYRMTFYFLMYVKDADYVECRVTYEFNRTNEVAYKVEELRGDLSLHSETPKHKGNAVEIFEKGHLTRTIEYPSSEWDDYLASHSLSDNENA